MKKISTFELQTSFNMQHQPKLFVANKLFEELSKINIEYNIDNNIAIFNGYSDIENYAKDITKLYTEFKTEINHNLSQFDDLESRNSYIEYLYRIINDINELVEDTYIDIEKDPSLKNALFILNNRSENFSLVVQGNSQQDFSKIEFNPSIEIIRLDHVVYIRTAFEKIATLYNKTKNTNHFPIPTPKNKLKTNLSVAQLSYFFKLLNDEKLFDISTKSELHRFIAENFQTKKQENISENSVKNNMDNPDSSAIEFWDEKLLHLRQITNKIK